MPLSPSSPSSTYQNPITQPRSPLSLKKNNAEPPQSPCESSPKKTKTLESPPRTFASPPMTKAKAPDIKRKLAPTLTTPQIIYKLIATKQIKNLNRPIINEITSKLQSLGEIDDYHTLVDREVKLTEVYLGKDYNIEALGENNGQNSKIYIIKKDGKNIAVIKALDGKVLNDISDKRIHPYYAAAATIVSRANAEKFNQIAQNVQNSNVIPIKMNPHEVFTQLDYITFAPFREGESLDHLLSESKKEGKSLDHLLSNKVDDKIKPSYELTIIDTAAEPSSELNAEFTLQTSLLTLSGKVGSDNLKINIKEKINAWFKDKSKTEENLLNEITEFLKTDLDLKDKPNILDLAVSLTFHVVKAKQNQLNVDASLSNFIVTTKDDVKQDFQAVIEKIQNAQTGSPSSSSSPFNASAASTMIAESPPFSNNGGYVTP
jgi:hypothetical protein